MKKNVTSLLEVGIVTRNRSEKLLLAVSSLLANTILPFRIIIADSSSTSLPATQESRRSICQLCSKLGVAVEYLHLPHNGVSYSRNILLKTATQQLFAFIDDDELVAKDWVATILMMFQKKPNMIALCGPKLVSDPQNYWHQIWECVTKREFARSRKTYFVSAGNSVYRMKFIKKHAISFDERLKTASEDSAFSLQLNTRGALSYFYTGLVVHHMQRDSLGGFFMQWFNYGSGTFLYKKLYFPCLVNGTRAYIMHTLHHFRTSFEYNFIPYRSNKRYAFGLFVKDMAFFLGYMSRWFGSTVKPNQ